ncbi:MAG: menaquinol oxidoreductase [Acidobacteria bacterium]|nr:menaquinol oxidoreductase [Acidobacteriota bacterium]
MKRGLKIFLLVGVAILIAVWLAWRAASQPVAPDQPIAYNHWQHISKPDGPQLDCDFCHEYADKSAHATIPNITTCMGCHEAVKTDSPEVQKLAAYAQRQEQPKWVRVYFFDPEADVFFSHKPHVKANIACTDCHGNVPQLQKMRREVKHTMGWCIECHRQRKVSIDCYVCHR